MGWWLDTLIAEVTTLAIRGDDETPVKILGLCRDPEIAPWRLWIRSSRNATPLSSKQKINEFKRASDAKGFLKNACKNMFCQEQLYEKKNTLKGFYY